MDLSNGIGGKRMSDLITVPTENWEYAKECVMIVQRLKDRKRELLISIAKEHPEEHINEYTFKELLHELERIFTGKED